jgi:hypothetical protein
MKEGNVEEERDDERREGLVVEQIVILMGLIRINEEIFIVAQLLDVNLHPFFLQIQVIRPATSQP